MGTALEVNHVWKKFNRGEFNDSLRDAIPAMLKSLVGLGPSRAELQKNEFWALKDVNFKVEEGESVALIGHNGAGKSTLLKIFSKILKPNRGSIRVNGRMRALIEVGSGFHGDLTGRENIFLNGSILGMSQKEIASKFDAIVDFAGIGEFLDMPVKRYSSGMYARLGFAVAAHLDPEILIVDEVLAVGDVSFQKKCLGKMNEVAHEGRTVVFVSHNMAAVRNLCQRAILFDHGEMLGDGPAVSIIKEYYNILRNEQKSFGEKCRQDANQKAYIKKVLMGTSPDTLAEEAYCFCNEQLYVRVYFGVNEPLENSLINVVFVSPGEDHIMYTGTRISRKQLGRLERDGYVEFYLEHVPLVAGPYSLSILLGQNEDPRIDTKYIDHRAIDRCLHVEYVDEPDWPLKTYSNKMGQRCFVPYEWELHYD